MYKTVILTVRYRQTNLPVKINNQVVVITKHYDKDMQCNVVAVVNDTVGTLMSCAHSIEECQIGLIVGTHTKFYTKKLHGLGTLTPRFFLDDY